MGRQVAVAATLTDELAFLEFARSTAEVAIIGTHTARPEDLWVNTFDPKPEGHWVYYLWNRSFPWFPAYGQVNHPKAAASAQGLFYVSNLRSAPVVEFWRSDLALCRFGRLYWAGAVSNPGEFPYDAPAFAAWYEVLTNWLRRKGSKLAPGQGQPYFLPDAARVHQGAHA